MNREPRIDLRLALPGEHSANLADARHPARQPARHAADAQDEARFAAALAAPGASEAALPAAPGMAAPPPSPLLAPLWPPLCSPPLPPAPESDLAAQMGAEVERLLVDDGSCGHRQVRLELKDDCLPGVSVAIQENEGRLQVDFFCRLEAPRRQLNRALPTLAQTLAQRLQRPVLLRVQTTDEDDPCLLEALAPA